MGERNEGGEVGEERKPRMGEMKSMMKKGVE